MVNREQYFDTTNKCIIFNPSGEVMLVRDKCSYRIEPFDFPRVDLQHVSNRKNEFKQQIFEKYGLVVNDVLPVVPFFYITQDICDIRGTIIPFRAYLVEVNSMNVPLEYEDIEMKWVTQGQKSELIYPYYPLTPAVYNVNFVDAYSFFRNLKETYYTH